MLKILLTEGSSLSARQTLYALGGRHVIDVCDPKPSMCLARYSRYVRRCHRCPAFAADPLGYLQFLRERLDAERYDVLLPVHDQVYLLSRFQKELKKKVGLPVPEFAALEKVQSKASFADLLAHLNLPHPRTQKVRIRRELERKGDFPFYVKLPYSTAGCGVWHIENGEELRATADRLEKAGMLDGTKEILLQEAAAGTLCVAQSVFQRGRLLAAHTYQARAIGVGGSARARQSVYHPLVLDHLRLLGAHLDWHGALMLDYFVNPATGRPVYIEANPRIGETVNAFLSGLNLCELLVQVALDRIIPEPPLPRTGTRTHSVMMGLLALAEKDGSRSQLLAELFRAATGQDIYRQSQDEVTRFRQDPLSLLPALFLSIQLFINPRAARRIISRAVRDYALSETALEAIARS